jgi:hypothetical protein
MALREEFELPHLTVGQLEALRRFAAFEIGVEDIRTVLTGVFEFDQEKGRRSAGTHFRMPEPGIVITRQHIAHALELKRQNLITERDLVEWATFLLLNDAYVLDPGDEDLIAEWLNDISLNLDGD